jgi:hypothetical protein
MSAYSTARHLAVEVKAYEQTIRLFASRIAIIIDEAAITEPAEEVLRSLSEILRNAHDHVEIAAAVCDAIQAARKTEGTESALIANIRREIVQLVNAEVLRFANEIEPSSIQLPRSANTQALGHIA